MCLHLEMQMYMGRMMQWPESVDRSNNANAMQKLSGAVMHSLVVSNSGGAGLELSSREVRSQS